MVRTIIWIHRRDAGRKALQSLTAFFRSRHRDLAFKVILRPLIVSRTPGVAGGITIAGAALPTVWINKTAAGLAAGEITSAAADVAAWRR
jgi:hypothetical protein